MYLKHCALFIFFLLLTANTVAQTDSVLRSGVVTAIGTDSAKPRNAIPAPQPYVINGKVEDANTSEGLPFAIIYFIGTGVGVTSDQDGNFRFVLDSLPNDSLRIEAMGYKPIIKKLINSKVTYNYILELERANNLLTEFVVKASQEDPAVTLFKKVVRNKFRNDPDRLDNYCYEAYNRLEADLQRLTRSQFEKIPLLKNYAFVFDNLDTLSEEKPYLPLYLTETISDYYFTRKPKRQKEFIKASMVKGVNNESIVKYLGTLYQNINIFKNFIPVFDKRFVSPLSSDGLFYYRYKIKDTQVIDGHRMILMQFAPKRGVESCFIGDFWVVDTVYAIHRISMDVSKLANINWVDRISMFQEFGLIDTNWLCTKDKFVATFSIYDSKKLPGFIGRKTTTYHKIRINQDTVVQVVSDRQYKEDIIKTDSARLKDDTWWTDNRPDSLTKNEKRIYKMVDTINNMPITRVYKNAITFISTGVKDIGWLQLGPYYYLYSRNPVEGNRFRLTLGTSRRLKDQHFTGFVAYGTQDKEWKYGATGLWVMNRKPWTTLYAYYAHDVNQSTNYYDQVGSDNIFSAVFRKAGVPWKLAFANDARIQFFREYFNGFSFKLLAQKRVFTPYRPLPSTSIFRDEYNAPTNSVRSTEGGIELRFAPKEKYLDGNYYRIRLANKYPVLKMEYTAGLKGVLGSAYNYHKLRFSVSERISIPPIGHLYYNVFAGKYFGKLPYPLLEIHPGNEFYYYNMYSFQMMNNYEFLSDEYMGFNIEHNLGGGIFNRMPLIRKLKFRQFWTAKGVWGSLSPQNQHLNLNAGHSYPFRTLKGDPYLEIGTGVSNIFKVFRIDFVWRVTPQPEANEKLSRHFGIFGSAAFEF
jgi:hypothetical protein